MRHLFLLAALCCACISYAQIRVQERLPKSKTGFALTTAKTRAKIYYLSLIHISEPTRP